MSVNSRLKATKIIGQRKAFQRQRIPEFSCARKETLDIDILVTSRNGDRKTVQSIRVTSLKKRKVDPVEPVLKNIHQSNTYRKGLSWPHFDSKPRVQEKQQVKDLQSCIFVFVACLTILSCNQGHQPRHDNSISYLGVWQIYRCRATSGERSFIE